MNKLQKFLSKLGHKERLGAHELIERILARNFEGLDVTKLKGVENLFRVRKGDIRVVYSYHDKTIHILDIGRRNDTTYNF